VENWGEVKNCFRYITATGPRVVEFDQPSYLLIDQRMEHEWPGKISNPEDLPINMTIDWIRLFQ